MASLYFLLVLTASQDNGLDDLKKLIYSLIYMDNSTITTCSTENELPNICNPLKFDIQQQVTNNTSLQNDIDKQYRVSTPIVYKLFGLEWNRLSDEISTKSISL